MDKELSASLLRMIKEKGKIQLTRKNLGGEFEKAVVALLALKTMGYIEYCLPHKQFRSGKEAVDLVVAEGITLKGEDYLEEIRHN